MHEIGEQIKIKEDHRIGYIYDVFPDTLYINQHYYHVVWYEEDLYRPRPSGAVKVLFWDSDIVCPKTKTLKNGKKLIISH